MLVPGRPFQRSLIFLGKARSLPQRGALRVGFSLTNKLQTCLERPDKNEQSSLQRKLINYGRKMIYIILLWCQSYKTFFSFVTSVTVRKAVRLKFKYLFIFKQLVPANLEFSGKARSIILGRPETDKTSPK